MARTILALVIRQMASANGRMPGGFLWSILSPAATIALFSVLVAAIGLRSPALGTNFPIFFATGILPFGMAMHSMAAVGGAIATSRPLLAYPRVTFLDAILAKYIVSVLTDVVVFYIVITFILSIWDTRTTLILPEILLSITMAYALGMGVGTVNCLPIALFPLYQTIWGFATRPLLFVSGVLFIPENIPNPFRDWLLWNPLVHVTGQMRKAFFYSYDAPWVSPVYVFSIAAALSLMGLLFLRRYYREILDR